MSSSNDYAKYLNSLNSGFTYYGMWIIWPTSVVGNIISLFIYTRPNLNKKTNTGFLYGWLCILNILTVVYYSVVYRGKALQIHFIPAMWYGRFYTSFLVKFALLDAGCHLSGSIQHGYLSN